MSASPSSLHDTGAVPTLIESNEKITGTPSWIAADTKYSTEECFAYLRDRGIKTSINPETKSNRPKHYPKKEFIYDKKKDQHICPEGVKLNKKEVCLRCAKRNKCIDSNSTNPRIITCYDSQCYQNAKGWYYFKYGKAMQKLRYCIRSGNDIAWYGKS